MKELSVVQVQAAELLTMVNHLATKTDASRIESRALAAVSVRARLAWLKENVAENERRYGGLSAFEAEKREIRFLKAALDVLDPDGACTQEVEDDARNAAQKADLPDDGGNLGALADEDHDDITGEPLPRRTP